MNTKKRIPITLGLVMLNIAILGGMLLPLLAQPKRHGPHTALPIEHHVLLERVSPMVVPALGVILVGGLLLLAIGIIRKSDEAPAPATDS